MYSLFFCLLVLNRKLIKLVVDCSMLKWAAFPAVHACLGGLDPFQIYVNCFFSQKGLAKRNK